MEHLLQMSLQALGVLQNCGNEVMEVRKQGRGRLHQYNNMRGYQGIYPSLPPYLQLHQPNQPHQKTSIKESCVEHMQITAEETDSDIIRREQGHIAPRPFTQSH